MGKFNCKGGLRTRKRIDQEKKRSREILALKKSKWKLGKDGMWTNPRSGRKYSEYLAISIEELNRTLNRRKYTIL